MNLWWGLPMVWAPKMTIRDSITFRLAKGVKQKRLLGGNPTNLSFFFLFCVFHTFIILLWLCFLCFFLRLCQAKPLWLVLGMIVWSCWKRQKLSAHEKNFHFFSIRDFELILLAAGWYSNFPNFRDFSEILRYQKYTKYTDCYRLVCC